MEAAGKLFKWLAVQDFHIPYHDKHVLNNILYPLVENIRFSGIIIAGDLFDCYSLSRFDKNDHRLSSFQAELDEGISILHGFKERSPRCRRKFLLGNHEERLAKQLLTHPQFGRLRALEWRNLLPEEKTGFTVIDKAVCMVGKVAVGHGDVARMHSGASARCLYQKWGTNLLIGHCHRMADFSVTNMRGTDRAIENGHVCDPEQLDYTGVDKGKIQNWQQGFSIIYYRANGWFDIRPVHINDGRCIVEGRAYGW